MSTEAQLKAISNTELASGTQIPALKHRTVNNAIIEEMYDSQSRGDVLSGVQSAVSLSGGDQVLVIRSGAAFLLDATEFGFVDALADLTDVNIPTPANDQVLSYNTSTGKWEAKDISALPGSVSLSGVYTLNRLTKITGVNTIGQTIVSDDGTTVNVGGNLSVDNNLTVGTINSGTSSDFVKGDGSLDSTDYQGQISTNTSNITTNTNDIATNTSNISTNTSAISTNQSNITTNASNISTNASNIATNTSDISDNALDIITNANNISTNTSDIATNTSNISTNTSNIATNTSNIATNTSNIATNTSDIATNTSNIATNTSDITDLQNDKQDISEKSQANGYAPLDSGAKIPLVNLPDSVLGQVTYEGTWNASTNTPTLANPPASTTKGDYYVVNTGGTQFSIEFQVGDWIISNGAAWEKVDNTDAVTSVFGRLGNVVANAADYASFYPPNSRTINAGTGLTGGGDLSADRTISHADTSSQSSVDNTGLTFIQDVTLDPFGHVTGLGSATVTLPTVNDDTITLSAGTGLSGGGAFTLNQSSAETITFNNTDRGSSQSIFKNVAVGGQSTIVADSNNDTLTFAAGSNVTITTNASTDTITINSSFTDTNNFVNSASFNTGNGILTLGRSGLSDVTVDLDGRYATSASLANVAYTNVNNNFSASQTITSTSPSIVFDETDVTPKWRNRVSSGSMRFQYASDGSTYESALVVGATTSTINRDTTINGTLTSTGNQVIIEGSSPNLQLNSTGVNDNARIRISSSALRLQYSDNATTYDDKIVMSSSAITLEEDTTINGNLSVSNSTTQIIKWSRDASVEGVLYSDGSGAAVTTSTGLFDEALYLRPANSDVRMYAGGSNIQTWTASNTTINGTLAATSTITGNTFNASSTSDGIMYNWKTGAIRNLGTGMWITPSGGSQLRIGAASSSDSCTMLVNRMSSIDFQTTTFNVNGNTTINGVLTVDSSTNRMLRLDGDFTGSFTTQSIYRQGVEQWREALGSSNEFLIISEGTGGIGTVLSIAQNGNTTINGNLAVDTDTLFVDATNNRVGIGTNDAKREIHISNKTQSAFIRIESGNTFYSGIEFADDDPNIGRIRYNHSDDSMEFRVNDGERMRIDSSGNVGIGTNSPSAKLDVNGDVIIGEYLSGGDGEILVGQDASSYYLFAGFGADVSKPIRIGDNPTYISIHTANSERMRIDSSGNIGIGTSSPSAKLDVNGDAVINGTLDVTGVISTTSDLILGNTGVTENKLGNLIGAHYNASEENVALVTNVSRSSFNYVNIGGGSSSYNAATDIRFFTGATTTTTGGTERMRIDSSGNVKIGSGTASAKLDVDGNAVVSGDLTVDGLLLNDSDDRSGLLEVHRKGTSGWGGYSIDFDGQHWSIMGDADDFGLYDDTNNEWILRYDENATLALYHNGSIKLNTTSSGISVTGSITATGDVSANNFVKSSDSRIKTELEKPVLGMDLVKSLKAVRYLKNGMEETGFYADKLPEEAIYMRHSIDKGLFGMDYGNLFAVHNVALNEHDTEINILKRMVKELQKEVQKLKQA